MIIKSTNEIQSEARDFLQLYYLENQKDNFDQRWSEVCEQIKLSGTYTHTYEELKFGAKVAWRNSNRCIGRLFWKTLKVMDYRHIQTENSFLNALHDHIGLADGINKIRSTISIFAPQNPNQLSSSFSIKNYTLIMYAGYDRKGEIIGDPANIEFTKYCQSLGWKGQGTRFDILPVVYSMNGEPDQFHQLPSSIISEIEISHPNYEWFQELDLKWYKLPLISNMKLDIGGIIYPAAPFNGWYMLDEVATRNLGDKSRYDVLPEIAKYLNLDLSSPFWKEKALLVLNEAVYHSYKNAGAKIVDHHTAVQEFMQFMDQEVQKNREVTGDWSWLVPPTSGSTTEIFHTEIKNEVKLPNYFNKF